MSSMYADSPWIDANAELLHTVSNDSRNIVGQMNEDLNSLGPFWGDDAIGQAFAGQWIPGLSSIRNLLIGFSDSLDKDSVNTHNTAILYTNADDVNTDLTSNMDG